MSSQTAPMSLPQPAAEARVEAPRPGLLLPIMTLARREIVRFFRQRNRVIGALLQPVIFWIFFGSAFRASFKPPAGMESMSYQEYFFPGTIVMILLFTAIFSTISIIEDRREGFLQSVLVAPISRLSMVLGKILGGTFLAVFQGVLFLLLAFTLNIHVNAVSLLETLAVMCLVALALTGLGFMIAWRMESTQGFHAIMSVFLLPMWLLSGALFPATGVPGWLGFLMAINPLTYGVAALRHVMYPGAEFAAAVARGDIPSLTLSLAITAAFAAAVIAGSALLAGTRTSGDLH